MSVVLALGSFNLIHVGHLRALTSAGAGTHDLAIAVASDDLVAERTGSNPSVPESDRAELVTAFFPDATVAVVDDDRVSSLIAQFDPSVVVVPDHEELESPSFDESAFEPALLQVVAVESTMSPSVLRNGEAEVLWLPRCE